MSTFSSKIEIQRRSWKKLVPFPKTYVLTLNKKNKIFFLGPPRKKIFGGGKLKTGKKQHFFGLTEISGRNFGRKLQKLADHKFWPMSIPNFCGFVFGSKTKKLCEFKVRECQISKKWFYPPQEKWTFPIPQSLPGMV